MTLNRWDLQRWGKLAYALAVICFVIAAILKRADRLARTSADDALRRHETQHHEDWSE